MGINKNMNKVKKIYNVGIIGTGNIAEIQTAALNNIDEAELIGIHSRNLKNDKIKKINNKLVWYNTYREMLKNENIDIITISTPSGLHYKHAIEAIKYNKHVIIEKPIEIDLKKIDKLINESIKNNVKLCCFFPSRYMQGVKEAKKAIVNNRLGDIIYCNASVRWFRSKDYYKNSWRGTWEYDGGGALMNQSIHTIDMMQWLLGPVKSLNGIISNKMHKIETEDTGVSLLRFKSDAIGVIVGSTACWPGEPAKIEINGTKGKITLEEGRITEWKIKDCKKDEEQKMINLEKKHGSGSSDPMGITYEKHKLQYLDFINSIKKNEKPIVDGYEAKKSVEIILSIYKSSKFNKNIKLNNEK